MATKFFTNSAENTLINKFEGVFKYNPNIKFFDALVGYFRASGYFNIRPFLDQVTNIRILVGIDIDKQLGEATKKGMDFLANGKNTRDEFYNTLVADIEEADYLKEVEKGIKQFIRDIVEQKIQIKAHPNKNIHAKVYIFRTEPFNEHTHSSVITGSSNFTGTGFGVGDKHNYEFNVQLNDYEDVKFATDEFEKLWQEAVEIIPQDLIRIEKETYLNNQITPFEIYVKLLIDFFGNQIEYDPDSLGDLPSNFKKLSYQVDAVNEGFNMLLKHNGFILADVVGLGKTVIATMVANKFLVKNGRDNTKILVVYPPAIEKNWKATFRQFKIDNYAKFITNGSLHKILNGNDDYWNKEEYDLIIVDEAHKFRNVKTEVFQNLQRICKSPRENAGLINGKQKKVILVTATPLNNKPDDIYNQIQLFQDSRQSTLPITNLTAFFSPLIEEYKLIKNSTNFDIDKLRNIYGKIRKNVIEPITIRRTRRDLENILDYKNDLIEQNITFPNVHPPSKVDYNMDLALNQLFYKTMFYLIDPDKIKYYRYQAIYGLKEEIQKKYYENAETVSKSLAAIMMTQLVKRLESSFFAFKISLNRFLVATDRMIDMFKKDKIFIAPDADINKLLDKGWTDSDIEEEIEELSIENPKNQVFVATDFNPDFLPTLIKDAKLIRELVDKWDKIKNDPKLDVFLDKIKTEFTKPEINLENKLVIFSESKDTVNYLEQELTKAGRKDILCIYGNNRKLKYDDIVENFDANIDEAKKKNDFNIIISTEVLAEGINLHRANVVIHYDTPWNSIKLMQRIGRVNRIGTKAKEIYNFVFYPSEQGDSQIQLNKTSFIKIQAFHTAFGEDNQIFSTDEVLDDIKLFSGTFKEEEDERLKYLSFIRKFKKEKPKLFDEIKKLPAKSRVGRFAESTNLGLKGKTIAFLKTKRKFEFYLVGDNSSTEEITPIDAIKIFEALPEEKSTELIDNHHLHVNKAISNFSSLQQIDYINQRNVNASGVVALKAKNYLKTILSNKNRTLDDNFVHIIKQIVYLIDIGKYSNLPGEIASLAKRLPAFDDALKSIKIIAKNYSVDSFENSEKENKINDLEKPTLIISESFV